MVEVLGVNMELFGEYITGVLLIGEEIVSRSLFGT